MLKNRSFLNLTHCALLAGLVLMGAAIMPFAPETVTAAPQAAPSQEKMMSFYDLSAKSIDGNDTPMNTYKGKVALVVNVASACGFTPQYAGLQSLFETYKDKGLVVLGFPSNEFGGQEPGTEAEIKQFCSLKYKVNFPMFAKVSVKTGATQAPVYQFLTKNQPAPRWNFSKYLVGKDGQVIAAYESRVAPDSEELRKAIETALAR